MDPCFFSSKGLTLIQFFWPVGSRCVHFFLEGRIRISKPYPQLCFYLFWFNFVEACDCSKGGFSPYSFYSWYRESMIVRTTKFFVQSTFFLRNYFAFIIRKKKTYFTSFVRNMFWATIIYKYHDNELPKFGHIYGTPSITFLHVASTFPLRLEH